MQLREKFADRHAKVATGAVVSLVYAYQHVVAVSNDRRSRGSSLRVARVLETAGDATHSARNRRTGIVIPDFLRTTFGMLRDVDLIVIVVVPVVVQVSVRSCGIVCQQYDGVVQVGIRFDEFVWIP